MDGRVSFRFTPRMAGVCVALCVLMTAVCALIQVLINAAQLVVPGNMIGGQPEPGEHHNENQRVPGLEPPADRVKDHSTQ